MSKDYRSLPRTGCLNSELVKKPYGSFARLLREFRLSQKLTQDDIIDRCGIDGITRYERGIILPNPVNAVKVQKAYNIPMDLFMRYYALEYYNKHKRAIEFADDCIFNYVLWITIFMGWDKTAFGFNTGIEFERIKSGDFSLDNMRTLKRLFKYDVDFINDSFGIQDHNTLMSLAINAVEYYCRTVLGEEREVI